MLMGCMSVCMCCEPEGKPFTRFCVDYCPGTLSEGMWKRGLPFLCPWPGCVHEDWHFPSADTDSSLCTKTMPQGSDQRVRQNNNVYACGGCTPLFVRSKNTKHHLFHLNTFPLCLPIYTAAPCVIQQWQERSSCQKRKQDGKERKEMLWLSMWLDKITCTGLPVPTPVTKETMGQAHKQWGQKKWEIISYTLHHQFKKDLCVI